MKNLIILVLLICSGCVGYPAEAPTLELFCDNAYSFALANDAAKLVNTELGADVTVIQSDWGKGSPTPNCMLTGFVLTSEVWYADRCESCALLVIGSQATIEDVAASIQVMLK